MLFRHLGFGLQTVPMSNQKIPGFVFTNKAGKYPEVSLCATKQMIQHANLLALDHLPKERGILIKKSGVKHQRPAVLKRIRAPLVRTVSRF